MTVRTVAVLLVLAAMTSSSVAVLSSFPRPEAELDFGKGTNDPIGRWSLGGSAEVVANKVVRLAADRQVLTADCC